MTSPSNAPEASIRIGPQGLSTPPPTLITDTTHEGSARPAEHPAPQDPSLVPSVSAVPSATVGNVSVPAEDEEDLPVPIYSPVPPFLEEELRGRSAQELLAEFEEPRPSSSLPSANSEFTNIPREWLMSLTELANQGVDIPSLLRSTDPVQVGASVAPVDVTHPSRSRPRGSSSVSSKIAHLSINPPEATTSSPQSSDLSRPHAKSLLPLPLRTRSPLVSESLPSSVSQDLIFSALSKPLDAFQGPVLSPLIVGPTDVLDDGKPSGTNPRLVPSNVFLDPVPFRKGSRKAGSNVDLASNPTSKFGKSAINPFETSRSPFPFPLPRVRSDSILIPSNEVSNRSHSILSLTQTVSRPINSGSFLQLQILINDVSVTGTIDTAASCSVISKDLAMSCSMEFVTDSIEYLSANNVTTSSLGSAQGVLTFRLGNIANLVRVSHSLPVIPGSNILLIGTDILTSLGLLNEDGVFIKLNREHSVILQDEAKFDHLIPITTADELFPDQISADFLTKLAESDCEITLDDPNKQTRLIKVLESFSEVFQSKPHPDGINCPPMEIPFHSEDVVVKMKPRNLNPNKLRIARDIFTDLVNSGFAYFTKDSKFGSPIVLVTYPDHRKPRLTGDFSGATGVNANTKTVVPNLPKISDILEFLSSAQFSGTLDLPKAFWQLDVAIKDQEKTILVIPGMSIAFRRACFGLKNVPAIFQNIMMEIFDIPGVFIYIDDVIIADSSFDGFLDKIRTVLHRAKLKRVNLGLNKCRFSSSNHPFKILGHVFLNKTRFIDSSRIDALNDLPRPTTLKEVRSFIGSINYLRDWLPDISSLIAPIINLTKGSPKSISWTPALDNLFVKIKSMIANHIPLTLPDQEGNILISTDASDIAVGGVVWLERPPCAAAGTKLIDRKVLPLSFYSKILSNSQKNWSVFQKELYAILLILTESTLSSFLRSRHLTIFMDHQNIAFLYSAPEKNRIVKRWIPILTDFDFDIEHTKGEDNHWADMLSRFVPQHLSTDKARNPDFPRDPISIPSHSPSNVLHDSTPLKIMCLKGAISQDLPVFDHLLSKIRSEQKIALTNKDPLFVEPPGTKSTSFF
ncbi:hypothetical protein RCL1_005101 [Eukaryota sp. TZLM3-RCL]